MSRHIFWILALAAILTPPARAASPRVVDSLSSIVGLGRSQTAVLSVVDDGSAGSPAVSAHLAIVDGTSNVLAYRAVALKRGKVESLSFPHDGRAGRIPLRGLVRLYGAPGTTGESRPFSVTLELVGTGGATNSALFCPADFLAVGPVGRGDVMDCPTDCNVTIVAPGSTEP